VLRTPVGWPPGNLWAGQNRQGRVYMKHSASQVRVRGKLRVAVFVSKQFSNALRRLCLKAVCIQKTDLIVLLARTKQSIVAQYRVQLRALCKARKWTQDLYFPFVPCRSSIRDTFATVLSNTEVVQEEGVIIHTDAWLTFTGVLRFCGSCLAQ
jgi:hypothetical protein